jgi:hypothetical protein
LWLRFTHHAITVLRDRKRFCTECGLKLVLFRSNGSDKHEMKTYTTHSLKCSVFSG